MVAIAGDFVVVGAPASSTTYTYLSGSAYVFRTTDGGATYVEVAKLTNSDPPPNDNFGSSVAIDGNAIVVGVSYDNDGGSSCGSAYVFRTTDGGATYVEIAKLKASEIICASDYFGGSVAISGGTVVVGAHQDDDDGSMSGSAYVFRTADGGATYAQVAKLTASDAASDDRFGASVAIDGGTIVVGAYGDDDDGSYSGSAYVFRTTDGGATYAQVAKLTASDAAEWVSFGSSVAIDGETIVV